MTISLIAAMSRNFVIGKNNSLPWNIKEDMKHFRELTLNKPVVMGRKTFESIGKPLPERQNIILTKDRNYKAEGCVIVHTVKEAIKAAGNEKEIMVIGGSQIYELFLPIADMIYLTIIEKDFEGDAFFPKLEREEWKEISRINHYENGLSFSFVDFERIKK
ncbi:MAG TPA: dihydrofolate reductase [Candidatus Nanoarchaeia archaeon]|nr:dihydrofolate reductase [Candidatus Nanoarchaeia archaeon]